MGLDDPHTSRASDPDDIVYDRFSERVCAELGRYVYRLVDPRDGETFYVGRGVNNRIFDHMEEAADGKKSSKTDRINAIHRAGAKVRTVIHRHALRDEDETATVEAALIQAYPDLTNQVAGTGTKKFGARSTDEAIKSLDLPPASFTDRKCLLLSISKRWPEEDDDAPTSWSDLYARSRHGWSLDVKRAQKADWVVAHAHGIVRAAFSADSWLPSADPIFAAFPKPEGANAHGFIGRPAASIAWRAWVDRRIPDRYRTRFGNPVRYVNI